MPPLRGRLDQGSKRDHMTVLSAGHCFKIVGTGGPDVQDLDLLLFDPNLVQIQRDVGHDPVPVIGQQSPLCPTLSGVYRLQARMVKGEGEYAIQVSRTSD